MAALELSGYKDREVHVQSCSAKTGDGLEDGIKWLVEHSKKPA